MASKTNVVKKKKKSWYGIYAPDSLNNAFLGDTNVYTPDDMVGKSISMNLAMVTNDMKKQNVIVSFRVNEVKDNKGLTELIGYSLTTAHLKRLVRRKRDKIDDSFLAKSKDGKNLRIKTVIMTNSKTHESATSAVRLSLRAKIKKALKEVDYVDFVNSLINVRLQKDWKNSLSKIYPLKFLEIRYVGLEESKKAIKESEEMDFTDKVSEDDEDYSEDDKDVQEESVDQSEDEIDDESDDVEESAGVESEENFEDDEVDDSEEEDEDKK